MDRLVARLTKRGRWCKKSVALLLFPLAVAAAPDPMPPPATKVLRDCIAAARNAVAIAACEKQQQATLKVGIERLSAAIRTRLDARERLVFDRSSTAWQTFLEREIAMLDLSLEKRGDGLGASLRPGAITLLFEQREQQLREHLHNLSATRPAVTGAGR